MPVTLLDTLSTEAFSSVWYWVVMAIVWSRAAYAPMGIPVDAYDQASRLEDNPGADVFALIRLSVARQLALWTGFGPWLVGGWMFALSGLTVLGVSYRMELPQALLCLLVPLAVIQAMTLRTAWLMSEMDPDVDPLMGKLLGLRRRIQFVVLLSIFVTALYGMLFNLSNALL